MLEAARCWPCVDHVLIPTYLAREVLIRSGASLLEEPCFILRLLSLTLSAGRVYWPVWELLL